MENTKIANLEIEISSNSSNASKSLDKLVTSLGNLKGVLKGNVVGGNLKKIGDALANVNANSSGVRTLKNMNKALSGSGSKFSTYTTSVKNATSSTKGFTSITGSLGFKLGAIGVVAIKVAKALAKNVKSSTSYIESLNLFSTTMGGFYDEALDYAELVSDRLGIDVGEWVEAQGTFSSIAKGFGFTTEQAYKLSKGLTELSYDLASLKDFDNIEEAFNKVRSGFAGELEPLRNVGFALDQATLQQVAYAHGIDLSYTKMTQSQKAMLRYTAIVEQATQMGMIYNKEMQNGIEGAGDMAKTLDSPANAIRRLKAAFSMLTREIGNVFLPLVSKLAPILIALTKVVTNAVSGLAKLFGFKYDVEKTTTPMQNIAGAIDEATESAEEYKKATMGFDELNVIDPPSSSTGSNGYGADLGLNIEEVWNEGVIAKITTEVDGLQAKFQKLFETLTKPLQVISFENIKEALGDLGVALAPFTEAIGAGLWWFYTEVLVPLAEWTIEEVLPNFFKLLGEAITIAQPYIVAVGNFIKDTLYPNIKSFGEWVIDNGESIVTWVANLAVAFGALYGAYKGIEFLSFIQQVGGVTSAIGLLTSAIKTNIVAKLIDKAETIALNLLYAKDFLVNIGKATVALLAQAGAFAYYNVLVPIATTVTTALSTALAFLTSPIGLVITALGLLVAGIVYLWNTNEDFRNAVLEIWEAIKSGVTTVINWLTEKMEGFKTTISNIVGAITSMVARVKSAVASIKSAYESVKSTASNIFNKVGEALNFGNEIGVKAYATGGVVSTGQMFIARENGAELVGNIGGSTAVMNNDQIVQAVSQGVAQAVASVMGGNNSQNITIELDGEVLYRSNQRVEKRLGYNLGI